MQRKQVHEWVSRSTHCKMHAQRLRATGAQSTRDRFRSDMSVVHCELRSALPTLMPYTGVWAIGASRRRPAARASEHRSVPRPGHVRSGIWMARCSGACGWKQDQL